MRKSYLKFLTCLAMTVAVLSADRVFGQTTSIFSFDQTWQYYQEGNQPANQGTITWRTNTYNDTTWSTGQGVFAYEDAPGPYPPILTSLNRTVNNVPGGTTNITYYFRTHFDFPSNPLNAVLYFTNVIDDGMILYLNGMRLYDFRVAQVNPAWSQYASGGPPAEGARELFSVTNSALLRQGDNVLAVELHDGGLGSSDVAYGLALAYRFPVPIQIVTQPSDVDAQVGDTVDLSVEVVGDQPRFWWFRNNALVVGPTNNSNFRISNIQLSHAGTYHVVVSNAISGARSSNAIVTVVVDTFPPEYVDAVINEGDTNRVYALFTEDVLRANNRNPSMSATNIANYSLREVLPPGREIAVTAALPGTGSRAVRLTLETNIDCSKEYVLTVRNLTDTRTNLMSPNPGYQIVGCVFRTNVVAFETPWKFNATFVGGGLETNWYATNYVPGGDWGDGVAPFYYSQDCITNCYGRFGASCPGDGTPVSVGYPTYVFRKEFVLSSNSLTAGQLRLSHVIDDGAIFYLNGKELLRFNMATGAVDFNYLAPCRESLCLTQSYSLNDLKIGTNVFAVEVHSCDEFVGADFMFGCQLDIIFTNFPTRIPNLRVTRTSPNNANRRVFVNWDYRGWQLQTSTNLALSNAWGHVAGVSTNVTGYTNNTPTDRQRYYRLVRPRL